MYSKYIEYLKSVLNERRFQHSLNVADECAKLAKLYNYDENKAYFCGLIHDICKNDSDENMLQMFSRFGIILDDIQQRVHLLWHSIAGSLFIQEKFGIDDIEIVNSIRYHTTGRENMSKLEKIVYVADIISSDRCFEGVEELRKMCEIDLDLTVVECLKSSIKNLSENNKPIHKDTIKAYNFLIAERM